MLTFLLFLGSAHKSYKNTLPKNQACLTLRLRSLSLLKECHRIRCVQATIASPWEVRRAINHTTKKMSQLTRYRAPQMLWNQPSQDLQQTLASLRSVRASWSSRSKAWRQLSRNRYWTTSSSCQTSTCRLMDRHLDQSWSTWHYATISRSEPRTKTYWRSSFRSSPGLRATDP